MPTAVNHVPSSLLQYLPAIYAEDPFLGRFLLGFERILLGRNDGVDYAHPGLEETISRIAEYLDPEQAPESFLPWLSTWTGFALRADLDIPKQRHFLATILQLYRWRGTKQNLQTLLKIFTISTPTIVESEQKPHHFTVTIALPPKRDNALISRQVAIAHALIALEKPAHTSYELFASFPSMQVGVSRVGIDTLLGSGHEEKTNG